MTQTYAQHFEILQERYFVPLCQALKLSLVRTEHGDTYSVTSAALGNVRIFFESERGLGGFGIGEAGAERSLCGVEELAERFPRIRLLPEGHQRLDLDEQSLFIQSHWQDLQVMFSSEHLRETTAWKNAAAKVLTKKYSRDT